MNGDLRISKKSALGIIAAMGIYAMADFVTIVDTKSTGGITVTGGVTETQLQAAIDEVKADYEAKIAALEVSLSEDLPIGTVAMWTSSTLPTGWIEMRGQSTSAYPELASIVGSTIPDMRGRFARGWNNDSTPDSGRTLLSYQVDQLQNITGTIGLHGANSGTPVISVDGAFYSTSTNASYHTNEATAGSVSHKHVKFNAGLVARTGTETRPMNIALMYIIKAE